MRLFERLKALAIVEHEEREHTAIVGEGPERDRQRSGGVGVDAGEPCGHFTGGIVFEAIVVNILGKSHCCEREFDRSAIAKGNGHHIVDVGIGIGEGSFEADGELLRRACCDFVVGCERSGEVGRVESHGSHFHTFAAKVSDRKHGRNFFCVVVHLKGIPAIGAKRHIGRCGFNLHIV